MTLKKIKTIAIFGIFILCFITHFMYTWFPNFIFSIFFPVNESIFEHMKMITSSILIWSIIEYFILKKYKVYYNNYSLSIFIAQILAVIIFLIIYYPIYSIIGENFILNIVCLFIAIYFTEIISFIILDKGKIKNEKLIGIIGIAILYIGFTYLTYNPPRAKIFYDTLNKKYGINHYQKDY